MRTNKYLYFVLCSFVLALLSSCEPKALTEADVLLSDEAQLQKQLAEENPEGYTIYNINTLLAAPFMTENGNFMSDSSMYRTRSQYGTLQLFSIDTLPTNGPGIYIRGRITTDDFGGNFYKSMVIQQIVDGQQQNLRISADLGSSGGMYQIGQEILIRCNGLAVGRYSNQPQLCIPTYNNNIYAMNAAQKVGWAPGRIPAPDFRKATRMIGVPDQSKLVYDTLTLNELFSQVPKKPTIDSIGMDKVRKADGRLVVIKDVYFTGGYDYTKSDTCTTGHPDEDGNANVFAPTTNNIGYPQSRVLSNGSNKLMCSCSEYAKFAYFYLPGANKYGIKDCKNWKGTITGILGWYQDNAKDLTSSGLDGSEWSVTPRGIPGYGVEDIEMFKDGEAWIPLEYNPKESNE
jgi:hypothetical protein